MRLARLLQEVGPFEADGALDVAIRGVTCDSRRVERGDLFVALQGERADGNRFAAGAVGRGAVAVLSSEARPSDVRDATWVRVDDARAAMALAAGVIQGHPDRELPLIGITGTNGKTTTAYLLESILGAGGRRPGVVGTVTYRWPDHEEPAARTTPEAPDLHRMLRGMVDAGCGAAVLEVSSHALSLRRVHGMHFQVGVFTNLTQDHLDYHRDMDAYFAAKAILFESLGASDTAVLNADDPRSQELRRRTAGRVVTFGVIGEADVRPVEWRTSFAGTEARLATPAGELEVRSPLPGRPNLENVMAATGAALAIGASPDDIRRGVAALRCVPGRFERIEEGQPFHLIVDYAHTDDALRNVLKAVRALGPARVITVFGCGGDRDREKRPLMGAAAAAGSDVVILTSDNPRSEDPAAVAAGAEAGVRGVLADAGRRIDFEIELDRRRAITRAVQLAGPGDAVVIAGKGHEHEQIIGNRVLPFDDREVCREILGDAGRGGDRG